MEDKVLSRKEFFREGIFSILKPLASIIEDKVETRVSRDFLRPPGAIDEIAFLTTCTRCPHCADACPREAIKMAGASDGIAAGTPYINPYDAPCTLCIDLNCIKACPTDALDKGIKREDVRMGLAVIDEEVCLARQGMMCEACFTICPLKGDAIYMDGLSGPVIDSGKCTGCGVCAHSCVSKPNSIKIIPAKR
jgi:MauM/NapG family ferredoxin protein